MESKIKTSLGAVIDKPGNSTNNKTGGWRVLMPVVDNTKCVGCNQCWVTCPDNTIKVNLKTKKAVVDYDFCKGCGICSQTCPANAIRMVKEEK